MPLVRFSSKVINMLRSHHLMIMSLAALVLVPSRAAKDCQAAEPFVKTSTFGMLPDGRSVKQFELHNNRGMQATIIEYGATITELLVPDRDAKLGNIILGSDKLDDYTKGFPAASVIGRFANRIRGAKFTLDGQTYSVTKNSGENHIHGGRNNFAKVLWSGTAESNAEEAKVRLTYTSPDGEEGFPGELKVAVTYTLSNSGELQIGYFASTDKATVVNLTNHVYFNLSGPGGDVLNHELQILASNYTVSDKSLIPTGEIASVKNTPLDFLDSHLIGERIEQLYEAARGYDHNYIIDGELGTLRVAARVADKQSGRFMQCLTTEPGVQLYTANGFNGNPFPKHGGFCLETQHYPDSPNQPSFPSVVVRPETPFQSTTIFRFSEMIRSSNR